MYTKWREYTSTSFLETNVYHTTIYYNYKIMNNKYIMLHYVTGSSKSGYIIQHVKVINEELRDSINDYVGISSMSQSPHKGC